MSDHDSQSSDTVWRRDEIESPCVKICVLHPTERLCMGCYRSGEEIAGWSRYTSEQRREMMDTLPLRAARMDTAKMPRRGGRAARLRDDE